ncbi:MAG: M48 family metalloprotease [Planctomycetota bacterium]|nr:M48 family metalloprotease [Planctomycetota bacterium]
MSERPKARLSRGRRILRYAMLAAFVTLLLAPSARRWVVSQAVVLVPETYDRRLGENVMKDVRRACVLVDDPIVAGQLRQITDPLMRAVPEAGTNGAYAFYIALDPSVNAYAAPGGFIVINSGLILEAESAEEIAGVLAHEVAHAARRHCMHGLVEKAGAAALLCAASDGESGGTLDWGLTLSRLKFSRDCETDADLAGLDYLRRARIRPGGMLSFFERLSRASDAQGLENAGTNLLSTHPLPAERLAGLKAACARLPDGGREPVVLDVDLKALQARLRELSEAHRAANEAANRR